jgi:broad specificity phosphatase PhoE
MIRLKRYPIGWLRLVRFIVWTHIRRDRDQNWIKQVMNETDAGVQSPSDSSETKSGPRQVTLYLVRHGQTQYNVEHRLPGQLPGVYLNDEGRRQASQLGAAIHEMPLTAIVSSPLERASETAEIVRGERTIPITFDKRLMDTDVGKWSGHLISDLQKNDPSWKSFVRYPASPPPGIEGPYEVLARVVAVAEEVRHKEELGNAIMLVAHADIIKFLVVHYLRLPIEGASWIHIDNASLTVLSFSSSSSPTLKTLNWIPKPGWTHMPAPSVTDAVPTIAKDSVSE